MSSAHVKVSLRVEKLSLGKGIENASLRHVAKHLMRLEIEMPLQEGVQRVIRVVRYLSGPRYYPAGLIPGSHETGIPRGGKGELSSGPLASPCVHWSTYAPEHT